MMLRVGRHFALHHFQGHFALQIGVQGGIDRAHAAGGDDGAQLEVAQHDRQHDGMAAFFALLGGKGGQVAGNEGLGFAAAASDHFQGPAGVWITIAHSQNLARITAGTSLERGEAILRFTSCEIGISQCGTFRLGIRSATTSQIET